MPWTSANMRGRSGGAGHMIGACLLPMSGFGGAGGVAASDNTIAENASNTRWAVHYSCDVLFAVCVYGGKADGVFL